MKISGRKLKSVMVIRAQRKTEVGIKKNMTMPREERKKLQKRTEGKEEREECK